MSLARENSTQRWAHFQVDRAELPATQGVPRARLEAPFLLLVADRKIVLDQDDARAHQHELELRAGAQEVPVFHVAAEAHDALHAGAVVPAAVEEARFRRPRQVLHITLKIPLRTLDVGGFAERDDAYAAGIERLGDTLDEAALAGGVAPLKDHDEPQALVAHPVLQAHQAELQPLQLAS